MVSLGHIFDFNLYKLQLLSIQHNFNNWLAAGVILIFFYSMASYKYGRSILLGKRVTHWGQKTLPFLLREVILKKWFCKCYRVTVNFISTTVVETLACYLLHTSPENTHFGIVIIFDWIVHNKQNLVYCIFLTFFGIFWHFLAEKQTTENCWWNEKLSLEIFSWLPILVGEISLLSFVRQAYLG